MIHKTYRFPLRGIHNLNHIGEPTHGHNSFLDVTVQCPIQNEGLFLTEVKTHILKNFDKTDWNRNLQIEATGERVSEMIFEKLKAGLSQERLVKLELIETDKNKFVITF